MNTELGIRRGNSREATADSQPSLKRVNDDSRRSRKEETKVIQF